MKCEFQAPLTTLPNSFTSPDERSIYYICNMQDTKASDQRFCWLKIFLESDHQAFFPFEISTIYSLSSECYKLWNLYLGFGYVLCYLYMH